MIIDLCCGIGRFESETEEVVSIDFDRKVKPTICADIRFLPLRPKLKPHLVHASPPCKYFSYARALNRVSRMERYDCEGIAQSLEIVAACFHAFDYLEAKTWSLENPLGFLSKLFANALIEYAAHDYNHKKTVFYSNNRALKRALIPLEVRQKLIEMLD